MDSFDLRWPKTQAMLYTDGIHMKIVVRDKRGPSGTIHNIELCKDRIAIGLPFAPNLLTELKSKGYTALAEDIEQLAEQPAAAPEPVDVVGDWLKQLDGSDEFSVSGTKRAKQWHPLGGDLFLKTPAAKGKQEWVLKSTPEGEKPSYLVAANFKGICAALREHDEKFFDGLLGHCAEFAGEHDELEAALSAWRKH